jgi:quercetin dioxygenase-like cupin family protein
MKTINNSEKLTAPFGFKTEIDKLKSAESWKRKGHAFKEFARYPDLRISLILLEAGARFKPRNVEGSISIQTIVGEIRLHSSNKAVTLRAGQLLLLDRWMHHEIEAIDESALLLSIIRTAASKEDPSEDWAGGHAVTKM